MLRTYTCAKCGGEAQADDTYTIQLVCSCGRVLVVEDQDTSTFVKAPNRGYMMGGVVHDKEPPVKPRRFLVFSGEHYYPSGGWGDLIGSADTIEDAKAAVATKNKSIEWAHIVDLETGEEV